MPRPILSRPRTRIYDANYNAGESYYRPALDRLDRKYSGRPLSPTRRPQTTLEEIAERHGRVFAADEELAESRKRAERAIHENNIFDNVRQGSLRARQLELLGESENGLNDEFASSTTRSIRASRKVATVDDVDLESTSNALKTHRLLDRSEKILDSVGIADDRRVRSLEENISAKRRSWRRTDDEDLTRWQALDDSSAAASSAAARRAKASKARLDDLEDEMAEMQEKQVARERRVARLKQLVAECESETVDDAVEHSVSISARKEKKSVHF